jgi:hypothetical protein
MLNWSLIEQTKVYFRYYTCKLSMSMFHYHQKACIKVDRIKNLF